MRLQSRGVADPCVEPYLFDVLDIFVSPVATVSITFSCPLETLPLSFLLFATRSCICCAFVYLLRVSVMCCVVLWNWWRCFLTLLVFWQLACVFLSCCALSSQGQRMSQLPHVFGDSCHCRHTVWEQLKLFVIYSVTYLLSESVFNSLLALRGLDSKCINQSIINQILFV